MKKTILILAILTISILLFGCTTTNKPNPIDGNGLVEQANTYCAQFSEDPCNNNAYLPAGTQEAIECYWNSEISVCQANIGYQ